MQQCRIIFSARNIVDDVKELDLNQLSDLSFIVLPDAFVAANQPEKLASLLPPAVKSERIQYLTEFEL